MDKVNVVADNYYEIDCCDLNYNDVLKEAYKRGFARATEKMRNTHQSQGHWIIESDRDENNNLQCRCSVCQAGDVQASDAIVPYCWHCGSHMLEKYYG